MAKVRLLRGTTHRFRCTFKDVVTEAPIAMASGVKVSFWEDGVEVVEYDANEESTGVYYYDYFISASASLNEWHCHFDGQTLAGAIQKRAAKRYYVIDAPVD